MTAHGRAKKAPSENGASISSTVKPTAKGLTIHPSALMSVAFAPDGTGKF